MPDISTIVTPDGQTRNIKDSTARNGIEFLTVKGGGYNFANLASGSYNDHGITVSLVNGVLTMSGTADINLSLYITGEISDTIRQYNMLTTQLPSHIAFTGAPDTDNKNRIIFALYNGSTWVYSGSTNDLYHDLTDKVYDRWFIYIPIVENTTYNGIWRPMIVDKNVYDQGFIGFQPYAKSNVALTTAISEIYDRCCSKNMLEFGGTRFGQAAGVTWSFDKETGIITANGTATGGDSYVVLTVTPTGASISVDLTVDSFCDGNHILSGCPYGGDANTYMMYATRANFTMYDYGNGVILNQTDLTSINVVCLIRSGVTALNLQFKPMICTKIDWDISHEYVPHNTFGETTLPLAIKDLSTSNGVKNIINITPPSDLVTTIDNDVYTISGTIDGAVTLDTIDGDGREYVLSWDNWSQSGTMDFYLYNNTTGNNVKVINTISGNQTITLVSGNIYSLKMYAVNQTVSVTFRVMLCTKAAWDISHEYKPNALSNIVTKETLGNVVDSISKNKLDWLNGHWNSAGTTEISGVRFTNNPDGSVTVDGTCTASAGNSSTYTLKLIWPEQNDGHLFENCVLAGCPNQNGNVHISIERYTSPYTLYAKNSGSAATEIDPIPSNIGILIFIRVPSGKTVTNQVVRPMICDKNYWYSSRKYQPYTLDNVAITPALINIVDNGQKNLLTESTASNVTGYKDISVNVPKGEYVFRIESLSTTAPDISEVKLGFYKTPNLVTSANIYIGTAVRRFVYVSIPSAVDVVRIFAVNSSDTSNTYKLSFSGAMLCDRSLWDVSQKFVPYRPSYKETVEQVAENENNISITDITSHFRAEAGYTIQSGISAVYRQGKHIFGTLSIKIDSGNLPTTLTTIALNGTDIPNSGILMSCGCGVDEMSIDSIGTCYYNNSLGVIKCKDTVSTNTCFNLQLDFIAI